MLGGHSKLPTVILALNSKRCLNLRAPRTCHSGNHTYLVANKDGIWQRCHSPKHEVSDRLYGCCSQFSGRIGAPTRICSHAIRSGQGQIMEPPWTPSLSLGPQSEQFVMRPPYFTLSVQTLRTRIPFFNGPGVINKVEPFSLFDDKSRKLYSLPPSRFADHNSP